MASRRSARFLFLLSVFMAVPALADVAAVQSNAAQLPPAPVNPLLAMLIEHALGLVLSLIGLAITPVLALLGKNLHVWWDSKVKNQQVRELGDTLIELARGQVEMVGHKTVDAAKDASASGKLPPEVAQVALDTATSGVKNDMGPALWAQAEKVLGSPDAVLNMIKAAIEVAVSTRNKEQATADAITAAPPADEPRETVQLPGGHKLVVVGAENIAAIRAHLAELPAAL